MQFSVTTTSIKIEYRSKSTGLSAVISNAVLNAPLVELWAHETFWLIAHAGFLYRGNGWSYRGGNEVSGL